MMMMGDANDGVIDGLWWSWMMMDNDDNDGDYDWW